MSSSTARSSRSVRGPARLAVAAVLSGSVLVAGCTDDGEQRGARRPAYHAPERSAPVRAPAARDGVLTERATPAPLEGVRERPNLLMITLDDAAWEDMEYLPHVQELMADGGMTLEQGLSPTPVCVPARATLLTGQYARNHGAVTINGEGGGFTAFEDDDTLPVALQEAGYDTLFLGKYLNGYTEEHVDHEPPGWTVWRPTVDFSTYNFENPRLLVDGDVVDTHTYSTTLLSDQSTELLEDPERSQRPWYLWLNYVAPHHGGPVEDDDPEVVFPDDEHPLSTTVPEDRDRDTFSDLELPDKPNVFEEDPSDKVIVSSARETVSQMRRAEMREAHQQRVEALQSVDRAVARTFDTLRSTGELDDTYVVLTSDNGFVLGEHNLEGKLWYFRDIVGVPMYVRGPGIPAGTVSRTPVSNADWAPTFAALAGATLGRDVDGVDVLPWLDARATRRVVPIAGWPIKGGLRPLYTGVVVGPWTYAEGRRGQPELYYRSVDPYQLDNLATDPRYRGKVKELRRMSRHYRDCAGSTCPTEFYR
ncbi:sulfatase [Nocardioides sp. YIM 152315]|uniref:sulfatase family protein n=1 Tax=Nocardioides sp. YIM 152315 TaxID=3031760 RepID=UPI0023DB9167|nr:sulfatase [Nocardioides sp. YIM 152315]MDF1603655.1 sulfatase [Nocardioides sp. YIM 152315]